LNLAPGQVKRIADEKEKEINEIVKVWILFVIEQQKFANVRCLLVCVRALVKISLFFPGAHSCFSLCRWTHTYTHTASVYSGFGYSGVSAARSLAYNIGIRKRDKPTAGALQVDTAPLAMRITSSTWLDLALASDTGGGAHTHTHIHTHAASAQ
jgi:hypothetical protein